MKFLIVLALVSVVAASPHGGLLKNNKIIEQLKSIVLKFLNMKVLNSML